MQTNILASKNQQDLVLHRRHWDAFYELRLLFEWGFLQLEFEESATSIWVRLLIKLLYTALRHIKKKNICIHIRNSCSATSVCRYEQACMFFGARNACVYVRARQMVEQKERTQKTKQLVPPNSAANTSPDAWACCLSSSCTGKDVTTFNCPGLLSQKSSCSSSIPKSNTNTYPPAVPTATAPQKHSTDDPIRTRRSSSSSTLGATACRAVTSRGTLMALTTREIIGSNTVTNPRPDCSFKPTWQQVPAMRQRVLAHGGYRRTSFATEVPWRLSLTSSWMNQLQSGASSQPRSSTIKLKSSSGKLVWANSPCSKQSVADAAMLTTEGVPWGVR